MSICEQVRDPDECWYTHATEQNNSAYCFYYDDNEKCLYNVAIQSQNIELCQEIEGIKNYTCQIKIAIETNNSELCTTLPGTWESHCLERIE